MGGGEGCGGGGYDPGGDTSILRGQPDSVDSPSPEGNSTPRQLTGSQTSTGQTPAETAASTPASAGPNARGAAGQVALEQYYPDGEPRNYETTLGERRVDVSVEQGDTIYAHEAKNYSRTVNVSQRLLEEVEKDYELVQTFAQQAKQYRPIWHFFDKGPSNKLAQVLESFGIRTIILLPYRKCVRPTNIPVIRPVIGS